jgi:Domain of unknown function (DU1801)
MNEMLRFSGSVSQDPAIDIWLSEQPAELGAIARKWFARIFIGAQLRDPRGLLEGTGKRMRHVKVKPGEEFDAAALGALIDAAYFDIKSRLERE